MNRSARFPHLLRGPRHLVVSLLAITLIPAAALLWLGWHQIESEQIADQTETAERIKQASDLIVGALQQGFARDQQSLADSLFWQTPPAEDAHIVVIDHDRFEVLPDAALAYYPNSPQFPEAQIEVFESGEEEEYRFHNYPKAIEQFRDLERRGDETVRAGAQLRIARNLRKMGQFSLALDVYERLAYQSEIGVGVPGTPADLVARLARCALLSELNRAADLKREAEQLEAELRRGRWRLDRASYEMYSDQIARWLERPHITKSDNLAAAVEQLWDVAAECRRLIAKLSERQSSCLRSDFPQRWSEDRLAALVPGPSYIREMWLMPLGELLESEDGVRVSLQVPGSLWLLGGPEQDASSVIRHAADTHLPWTVVVSSANPKADLARVATRRKLLLVALALLLTLVLVGGYFIARTVGRERAVAQLQSDFVATVSHEFRTPLTSLRQVTEILGDGRVADPQQFSEYYRIQARATDRLQRLVESLLDFGRMEAGTKPYCLQKVDAAELIRFVVDEFQTSAAACGHTIDFQVDGTIGTVEADPEALVQALWNLLDNAVKYSPDAETVWVSATRRDARLAISISDHGIGIPRNEHRSIFRRFVRGDTAKIKNIKGTGVGLAIVQHIISAHGGEIHLQSELGRGSTFTILLP